MVSNVARQHLQDAQSRKQSVVLWQALLWSLGLVGIGLLVASAVLDNGRLLACSAAVVPSLLLAAYQSAKKEREIFAPLNFVFLTVFMGVTLQTFYLCFLDDGSHRFAINWQTDISSILYGISAITIGIAALIAGYSAARSSRFLKRGRYVGSGDWREGRLKVCIFVMALVSVLSLVYFASVFNIWDNFTSQFSVKRRVFSEDTGVSTSLGYVRFGALLAQIAFFILLARSVWLKQNSFPSKGTALLVACGFLGAFLPFVASSRLGLISFILGACMVHHFGTGGWRVRQLKNAFIVAVCLIIVMGSLRFAQSRGLSFQEYKSSTSVASALAPVMASSNFLAIGKTAAIIDYVPQNYSHTYGSTYALWLIAPIPRAIWPDKPIVRIGGVLGAAVFGTTQRSGIPPGAVGEAYLNFGWLGIPFVLFILGVFLKMFYNTFGKDAYSNVNSAIIYSSAIIFVAFSGLSADFTGLMSNGLQRVVPLLFILWAITRKVKKQ